MRFPFSRATVVVTRSSSSSRAGINTNSLLPLPRSTNTSSDFRDVKILLSLQCQFSVNKLRFQDVKDDKKGIVIVNYRVVHQVMDYLLLTIDEKLQLIHSCQEMIVPDLINHSVMGI